MNDVRGPTPENATEGEGDVGDHRPGPISMPPRPGETVVARVVFVEGMKGRDTCPLPSKKLRRTDVSKGRTCCLPTSLHTIALQHNHGNWDTNVDYMYTKKNIV